MEWTRLENESEEHLLMRLVAQKEQIGTWDDIAKIMNELTIDFKKTYSDIINDLNKDITEISSIINATNNEKELNKYIKKIINSFEK